MRSHIYHTTEGDFDIPLDWKRLLGQDVFDLKYPLAHRLADLHIDKECFMRLVKQLDDFLSWYVPGKQKALGLKYANLDGSVSSKKKATTLKRYGVDNVAKVKEFSEKQKNTYNERYADGTDARERRRNKIASTCIERYGTRAPNMLKQEQVLEVIKENGFEPLEKVDNLKMYRDFKVKCLVCGHEQYIHALSKDKQGNYTLTKCKFCNPITTVLEKKLQIKFEEAGIKFIPHYRDAFRNTLSANREIDIYLPDLKVGLEINGVFSHNSTKNYARFYTGKELGSSTKKQDYHFRKTEDALSKGIRLFHIWEHRKEDLELFEYLLNNGFKYQYPESDLFTIRRDMHPEKPVIEGYSVKWQPEIWTTGIDGFSGGPQVVTYTSGLWVCKKL